MNTLRQKMAGASEKQAGSMQTALSRMMDEYQATSDAFESSRMATKITMSAPPSGQFVSAAGVPVLPRVGPEELRRAVQGVEEIPLGIPQLKGGAIIPKTGAIPPKVVPKIGPSIPTTTEKLRSSVSSVQAKLAVSVKNLEGLNERARIALTQLQPVSETGTFEKAARPAFRKGGVPVTEADLLAYKMSAETAKVGMGELVAAGTQFRSLQRQIQSSGDILSANLANQLGDALEIARKRLNLAVETANVQRFATNRIMAKGYGTPIPQDVIEALQSTGNMLSGLREVQARLPITTNLIRGVRNWGKLAPAERSQFYSDLINQFKLNLFSVGSWSLDMFGNASEISAQFVGGLGYDLAHLFKGRGTLPATRGMLYAIRNRIPNIGKPTIPAMEEAFGQTIGGELVRGGFGGGMGTFTTRSTPLSKVYDYLIGSPLYAKGFMDAEAGRLAGMSGLYRNAILAAEDAGVMGSARMKFINDFVANPSEGAILDAIAMGQKARFNRPLSSTTERLVSNPIVITVLDSFPRWGVQFSKWTAEMLGYNSEVFSALRKGTLTAEEFGHYIAKTATGAGGLYLLDKTLYDRVDFKSMEYVHPNGDRSRLSNREPISSGLFMLAMIHGDKEKATAALKFSSFPGAKFLGGEGGLLTGVIMQLQRAVETKGMSTRRLSEEFTDFLNRAIPGQALLGALKTTIDPIARRGLGAGLPGVSRMLPTVINPATGKPLEPKQRIPVLGVQLSSVMATPFPGARRVLDPVHALLFKYSTPVYRGIRTSMLGVPSSEIPDEWRDEWTIALGEQRQRLLGPIARDQQRIMVLEKLDLKDAQKYVQGLDNTAARAATAIIMSRHGRRTTGMKPLTPQDLTMPEVQLKAAKERRR